MTKHRIFSLILIVVLVGVGYFVIKAKSYPFRLGLDLAGGTELTYQADVSQIAPGDVNDSMNTLRDVIERRVNLFGVSEPVIEIEKGSTGSTVQQKLIVQLPGVTDINKAEALIGETPVLEFRLVATSTSASSTGEVTYDSTIATGLTGRYLTKATTEFGSLGQSYVGLQFNSEGAALFDTITKNHVGQQLAIFLDGAPISAPNISEEIRDGQAQISGTFTSAQVQALVRNLNYGALPVPITLIGTESVGASLGQQALAATVKAGIIGFIIIALFLIIWYRLPGVLASVALLLYAAFSLAVFRLIPVTLTSAGLAGFILSIGMAVDANILIFERMKEEMARGLSVSESMKEGFARAWTSIRDSNLSSIITAIVLYYFSSTSVIKGFALVFGIGVLISMFTAITVSRTFLLALGNLHNKKASRFLFGSGFGTKSNNITK